MVQASRKIGLLNHMGGGNLGDGGSLDAVIQNIRSRWPLAEICAFSMNPDDTEQRHGIPSYSIRTLRWRLWPPAPAASGGAVGVRERVKRVLRKTPRIFKRIQTTKEWAMKTRVGLFLREFVFLSRSFRLVRSLDLLIISGGGQFVEYASGPMAVIGGAWKFPYTIFKWTMLARVAGVRCLVLNVGAGPLETPLGKFFIRHALGSVAYVSFRDEASQALARRIGFKDQSEVFPDCAYSLDSPALVGKRGGNGARPVVGFAPMAFGDPRQSPKHDPVLYDRYIRKLGSFGSWLLKNGFDVTLFCTDIGNDPPVIEDLQKILERDGEDGDVTRRASLSRVHQWTTEDLLRNMSSMDFAVVVRFHAVVLAHMMNVPLLAINHHPKVNALMNDLGLRDYCVDVDSDLDVLIRTFESLVNRRCEVKTRMTEKAECYRRQLAVQFDRLFPGEAAVQPH